MKYLILVMISVSSTLSVSAQESKFKALFIYKFSEYIEWSSNPSTLVVGIAGQTDVFDQLSVFAKAKDNLEVIKIQGASEASKCNIVFLPRSQDKVLANYASTIGKSSILVVSENEKLATKGADIGFFLEQGKLRFLINQQSIENKGMTPSSKLLALGKSI